MWKNIVSLHFIIRHTMIFRYKEQEIELTQITMLYPAVVVKAGGESAQVSLEWANMKADQIEIDYFVLVFDIDPMHEVPVNRKELHFSTIEELFATMNEVAELLEK